MIANTKPESIKKLEADITRYDEQLRELAIQQEFEKCAEIKAERDAAIQRKAELMEEWNEAKASNEVLQTIGEDEVAYIVSKMTGIPIQRLEEGESQKLLRMEEQLRQRVVAQEEAIEAIAKAVRRSRAGLKDPGRPSGSFIFLGPTGVGKTELAKALAEFLFGDEEALIRIDMSEYMEKHAASRLVGAPPGYVGYDEGGQLTEKVRQKPYSVVLLDEIEKAHPDVFSLMLQVLDDGRLTDSWGHVVDFRNTVVILTSNVGTRTLKSAGLGFNPADQMLDYDKVKARLLGEVKKVFNPEFINRLDDIIVFRSLDQGSIRQIVDIMTDRLNKRLAERHLKLHLSDEVKDFLAIEGYDSEYGARPMRRAIQKYLEDPLSMLIIQGGIKEGAEIGATLDTGAREVRFRVLEGENAKDGEGKMPEPAMAN
jgi:ATP-dependent Clp protease ATP-binding subunit ClpC